MKFTLVKCNSGKDDEKVKDIEVEMGDLVLLYTSNKRGRGFPLLTVVRDVKPTYYRQ